MNSDEGFRELRASDALRVYYSDGALDRVVGERDCVLTSTESELKHSVRAPNVEALFAAGHLNRILARDGVDVEIVDEGGVRQTRSSQLAMDYEAGALSRAVQEGDFRLWKNSKAGSLELRSEKASYDPKKKIMEASGGKPRLKSTQKSSTGNVIRSETSARNFFLSREDLGVVAKGEVRSVFDIGDGSVVVTSGEMEADLDTGWASYSVEPRVVRGSNLFTADTIRVKSDRREMTGEGNVKSLLVEGDGPEDRQYRITSNEMQFLGNENRALYQGDVELESEDLTVNAPELELFFTDSVGSQFDRVEASGGVVVVEGERRWTGKSAVYYRADERVVVRNN
jgi:lipopolysaccharide export system protein LptA